MREQYLAHEGHRPEVRARHDHTLTLLIRVGHMLPAIGPHFGEERFWIQPRDREDLDVIACLLDENAPRDAAGVLTGCDHGEVRVDCAPRAGAI